ncbi:hypothetical protein ACTXT7_006903 [Hymenolepis weldensis]
MHFSNVSYSGAQFSWTKPNWQDYKVEHPAAVRYVKRLQELGLKDPWVRYMEEVKDFFETNLLLVKQ